MIVTLNGRERTLEEDAKIADVLGILGYESPRGLAVALDGEVIPQDRWEELSLTEGMKIEVLRAVQGG